MEKISIRKIQSSSVNNSIVLFDGETHLFLDFGAEIDKINLYLQKYNCNSKNIASILISHYHTDHIKALGQNPIFLNTQVITSKITANYLFNKYKKINNINSNFLIVNENEKKWIKIKNTNWYLKTFETIHDAKGSIAFLIKNKKLKKKIIYMTDTEYLEHKYLKNCDIYILESNYGASYLTTKSEKNKHIYKKINHMNIHESTKLLEKYISKRTKLFIFSHISRNGKEDKELIDDVITIYRIKYPNIEIDYLNPFKNLDYEKNID